MTDSAIPLEAEDKAILALECDTVVGHICHVVMFDPPRISVEMVRDRVRNRLELAPELRYRLGGTAHSPTWTPDPGLDLDVHVQAGPDVELDDAGLCAFVAERFALHLDRARPLWQMDVVPVAGGGTAVVWRLHHALADGATAVRLTLTALLDEPDPSGPDPAGPDKVAALPVTTPVLREPVSAERVIEVAHRDHLRRRAHLAGFLGREFVPNARRSPFDGTIGTTREIGFASTSLSALAAAARRLGGATINDAVLSVAAGAIREWLGSRIDRVDDVRVRVPVSLHHEGDTVLNRDSFFTLRLPLHIADPVERLVQVHKATSVRKTAEDAGQLDVLVHQLAGVSPPLQRFVERVQASPREFAVNISNVRGPAYSPALFGRPVSRVLAIAEIGRRHALRIGAISWSDVLTFGCCADPGLVPGVDVFAAALETETGLLLDAASR